MSETESMTVRSAAMGRAAVVPDDDVRFVELKDGLRMPYVERGSGPLVLFVHGSGGHHAAWWQQVAALRSRFTVLTVDLRGFGKSDSSMPEFDVRRAVRPSRSSSPTLARRTPAALRRTRRGR